MRRLPLVLLLLIVASVAVEARGQAPAAPAPAASAAAPKPPAVPGNKIAVIEYMKAVMESDPGKAAQQKGDKELAPEQAKLDKVAKEIADLQTKLQNAKTDAEKSAISRDLDVKGREGQRIQEDAERLREELREKLLKPIASMVDKAIDEYAKTNGVAVVFDPTGEPSNVIFADPSLNITSEVMRAVNAAYAKDPKLADSVAALTAAPARD